MIGGRGRRTIPTQKRSFMKIQKIIDDKLKADFGQFFLEEREILQEIVTSASVKKNEIVLEIGAGDGRLTRFLLEKAKRVIAVEIDEKFRPKLKELPGKVEIIIDDALNFLSQKSVKKFDKIVSNLPSSLVEPLFQKLAKINFSLAVFLVPEKFAYKVEKIPGFSLYFQSKLIKKVAKKAFNPIPKTNWEVVMVTRKPDPLKTENLNLYLQRYVFEHPQAKLKNSLREGIIKYSVFRGKKLTKNQTRKIIEKIGINLKVLESLPEDVFFSSDSPLQNLSIKL